MCLISFYFQSCDYPPTASYSPHLNCGNRCRVEDLQYTVDIFGPSVRYIYYCCDCPPPPPPPPTTTTTPSPAPPPGCFPATAKVNHGNGKPVTMSEVKIGDQVQTGNTKFYNFLCNYNLSNDFKEI